MAHHGDDLGAQCEVMVSPEQFHGLIKPRLKRLFSVFKQAGIPVIMHSCGSFVRYIPDLIELGVDLLEAVQPCMDLEYLKKESKNRLWFMGGIDTQKLLPFGTPDEVRTESRRVIRTLGKGGRYIIAPAQKVMKDVPLANIIVWWKPSPKKEGKLHDRQSR